MQTSQILSKHKKRSGNFPATSSSYFYHFYPIKTVARSFAVEPFGLNA
jgi:hypothetical protein